MEDDGARETERIPGLRLLVPLMIAALALLVLRLVPLPVEHVFVVVFTAVLIAAAVSPAATALQRIRIPRSVSVLMVYVAGITTLVGVLALIVPLVSGEVDTLRARLPQYNDELQSVVARVAPDQVERLSADSLINQGIDQLGVALSRATGFAVSASSVALRTLIVLVMGYFMAVEADFSQQVVMRFAPPPYRARVQRLLGRIGVRLGHWARAQLLLAVFFGLTFGLGLRVMGVPYSVTLGVIGGVIEIIPYVGGFITLVLAVLLAATKSPLLIAGVVIWYTVVVQTQSHVLAPVLLGRVVGMHPIVVVIALFVGIEAIGLLGALLAVPIAVVLQTLLDEFYVFGASLPEPAGGDFVARAPPWREADRVPTATGDGPETGA